MTKRKNILIVKLNPEDLLLLTVLAIGIVSTYNSNKNNLNIAITALNAAMLFYFFTCRYIRKISGGSAPEFTRTLNDFVSGLVFLVGPAIFMYHWNYNGIFESAALLCFIISGIFRTAALTYHNSGKERLKYAQVGMPLFWTPFFLAIFYIASNVIPRPFIDPALSVGLILYSFLMVANVEMKFFHNPFGYFRKKQKSRRR